MYCSKCGKELTPDTQFCPDCGTPVKNAAHIAKKAEEKKKAEKKPEVSVPQELYINMILHVLLSCFTFGIYNLVWVYKISQYVNSKKESTTMTPTVNVLLGLFVPPYLIYWTWRYSTDLNEIFGQDEKDTVILQTILTALGLMLVPVIMMQSKINCNIAENETGNAQRRLHKCHNCGRIYAETDSTCPTCSHEYEKPFYLQVWFYVVLGILGILGFIGFINIFVTFMG